MLWCVTGSQAASASSWSKDVSGRKDLQNQAPNFIVHLEPTAVMIDDSNQRTKRDIITRMINDYLYLP